jgi:ABC-type multidrug transport system fused ATPase/permease subunit
MTEKKAVAGFIPYVMIGLLAVIVIVLIVNKPEPLPPHDEKLVNDLRQIVKTAQQNRIENLREIDSLRIVTAERQKEIDRMRGTNERIKKDLEHSLRVTTYVSPDSLYADLNSIARDLGTPAKGSGPLPSHRQ